MSNNETDCRVLWEHARTEFIEALLGKVTDNAVTQDKIRIAFGEHLTALIEQFRSWLKENPGKDAREFLAKSPKSPFVLPPLQGGSRVKQKLREAMRDRHNLLIQIRRRVKKRSQYHNRALRGQAIGAVVKEVLGHEIPASKLNEWAILPDNEIALNAAAFRHKLKPEYLERRLSEAWQDFLLAESEERHIAAYREMWRTPPTEYITEKTEHST